MEPSEIATVFLREEPWDRLDGDLDLADAAGGPMPASLRGLPVHGWIAPAAILLPDIVVCDDLAAAGSLCEGNLGALSLDSCKKPCAQ